MNRIGTLELSPKAVLGLLCAAGVERLPAKIWPVQAALEDIHQATHHVSAVGRALRRWPKDASPEGLRYIGLREALIDLATSHCVVPSGEGWDAGYDVAGAWRMSHLPLLVSLPPADQHALGDAAQRLSARVSRFSKKAAAAAP